VSKEHLPISDAQVSGGSPTEILTPQQLAERLQVKLHGCMSKRATAQASANPDPLPHIKWGCICGLTGEMYSDGSNGRNSTRTAKDPIEVHLSKRPPELATS